MILKRVYKVKQRGNSSQDRSGFLKKKKMYYEILLFFLVIKLVFLGRIFNEFCLFNWMLVQGVLLLVVIE